MVVNEKASLNVQCRVEYVELSVASLTQATILRGFDLARRGLALSCFGVEGASVGYVHLDFSPLPHVMSGELIIEARELDHGRRWQRVQYFAYLHLATSSSYNAYGFVGDRERLVARAVGQTVGLGDSWPSSWSAT